MQQPPRTSDFTSDKMSPHPSDKMSPTNYKQSSAYSGISLVWSNPNPGISRRKFRAKLRLLRKTA